jgi:hypothetical protein
VVFRFISCFLIIDKESSSGEEYQNDDDDDDDESIGEIEPKTRRSSAAKRKSIAILSKDKTESWGNYRNTIDNGPVPRKYILLEHALTLNEIAFDVALKLQHQNQNQHLSIEYLDNDNKIEFINDAKMKEQVLLDTYRIRLSQNVRN